VGRLRAVPVLNSWPAIAISVAPFYSGRCAISRCHAQITPGRSLNRARGTTHKGVKVG
jgi:hypothetical protein